MVYDTVYSMIEVEWEVVSVGSRLYQDRIRSPSVACNEVVCSL